MGIGGSKFEKKESGTCFFSFNHMVNHLTKQFLNCPLSSLNTYSMGWTVQGSNPDMSKRFFSSPKCPDWLWGLPSLLFNEYWGSLLGVKWPGCKVNHSPLSSAKVKNEWSYTSPPPICLHDVDREDSTFSIILQ
jgi:hypothetical protein